MPEIQQGARSQVRIVTPVIVEHSALRWRKSRGCSVGVGISVVILHTAHMRLLKLWLHAMLPQCRRALTLRWLH